MTTAPHNTLSRIVLPRFLHEYLRTESASGVFMIGAAMLAIVAANLPFTSSFYHWLAHLPISIGAEERIATYSLQHWVKDVLMVLFFLLVGMELKHEMAGGFLSKKAQMLLPLCAAAGGMAAPALIYTAANLHAPQNLAGWAIPSATDIAFALCILTLAAKRVPASVKIFLLAIAIFDDLGAILIIAAFYSGSLSALPLLIGGAGIGLLALLNRLHITTLTPYMVVGILLWFCFHFGGIHTTLAGVLVGLAIPLQDPVHPKHKPLERCTHLLHPWVNYGVLPLFAFTSAGIPLAGFSWDAVMNPLPLGIWLGLFFGKQAGIMGMTWLAVRMNWGSLPHGANWLHIYGVSALAGIGFTMSLFISMLAFGEAKAFQDLAVTGILIGSLLSSAWGAFVIRRACGGKSVIELAV